MRTGRHTRQAAQHHEQGCAASHSHGKAQGCKEVAAADSSARIHLHHHRRARRRRLGRHLDMHDEVDPRVDAVRHFESTVTDLQLEHEHVLKNGLRSRTGKCKPCATAESDPDGRTVRGPQSRHSALSDTYREKTSDLAHPGLDLVGRRVEVRVIVSRERLVIPFISL